ncbi:MAG TPA: hypothetical protein VLG12_06070 [Candidatus Saccharimonadales bacterium]|nr:hypothetical protein [Candidatus Saccharimonadales bacterium]
MTKKYTNPCIHCGQERIVSRTWDEEMITFSGTRVQVSHTETVCPDPECQKRVNSELSDLKQKRVEIQEKKEKRAADTLAKKGRKAPEKELN